MSAHSTVHSWGFRTGHSRERVAWLGAAGYAEQAPHIQALAHALRAHNLARTQYASRPPLLLYSFCFFLLFSSGRAYAGQRNSKDKSWQQAAYTEEIAGPAADPPTAAASNGVSVPAGTSAGHNGNGKALSNGKGSGKSKKEVAVRAQPRAQAALPARAPTAPRAAVPAGLRRSALMGAPLRVARVAL